MRAGAAAQLAGQKSPQVFFEYPGVQTADFLEYHVQRSGLGEGPGDILAGARTAVRSLSLKRSAFKHLQPVGYRVR